MAFMKKIKKAFFLLPLLLVLVACNNSNTTGSSNTESSGTPSTSASESTQASSSQAEVKAQVALGSITHATTTLEGGNYTLNQKIEFEVTPDKEYDIESVKINNNTLTLENNKYSFTPTEATTYTLSVTTTENPNKIFFDWKDYTGGDYNDIKKGVKLNLLASNSLSSYSDLVQNGKIVLNSGMKFNILSSQDKTTWIRKIEFDFASGKENLIYKPDGDLTKNRTFVNGVWNANETRTDKGDADVLFEATGKVEINSVLITIEEFKAYPVSMTINGLSASDQLYYFKTFTYEGFQQKKLYDSNVKFDAGETYYFYLIPSQLHQKYYDSPTVLTLNDGLVRSATLNKPEDVQLPFNLMYYFTPEIDESKNVINYTFLGLSATKSIKIDDTSAIKYVKGYMETNSIESLQLSNITYGKSMEWRITPKDGFYDLDVIFNGTKLEKRYEDRTYIFNLTPLDSDENTISFEAKEGFYYDAGEFTIQLTGDKSKFFIPVAAKGDDHFFAIIPYNDYPKAKASNVKFNNTAKDPMDSDEGEPIYQLTNEEYQLLKSKETNALKEALFTFDVTDTEAYTSVLKFNSNNFTVTIPTLTQTSPNEIVFNGVGRQNYTITITPNENYDFKAIDVNDKRLSDSQITKNADGSVTFTFTATRLENEFLVQTTVQKVKLTENITTGFKIDGIDNEVLCGTKIVLELKPTSDEYFLANKNIVITYNNENITPIISPENPDQVTFEIIPIKTQTEIKVVITDKPLT